MQKGIPLSKDKAELRRLAEERLTREKTAADRHATEIELKSLLHELQVHQIELEMQNEELRRIQGELEAEKERYANLYTFAPIGYMTLNEQGLVLEANLTAANLLGVVRSELIGQPLTRFIPAEDQDSYYLYHRQLLEAGEKQICELQMQMPNKHKFWGILEATADLDGKSGRLECRVAVTDITKRKLTEKALEEERKRLQQALDEVRTLRGIVPICSSCKSIRNDQGYWEQMEKYIRDRSEAEFSHGICPDCAKILYPEFHGDK